MKYKVCTLCMTYNHGPYIKDALDGFAKQETKFPVVSVIIDDASTDGTVDVIRQYMDNSFEFDTAEAYKKDTVYGRVVYARHKDNKNCYFAVVFLKDNLYQCGKNDQKYEYIREWTDNAEFMAFCEGDDYWTAPEKLQVQVEAMEQHPELDISAHTCKRVHVQDENLYEYRRLGDTIMVVSPEKVIMGEGSYVITESLMMRQSLWRRKEEIPFWRMMDYDYTIQIAGALRGGLLFLPDCMANKRYGVPGSFTSKHKVSNKKYKVDYNERKNMMLEQLDAYTDGKYHKIIYKRILLNNIRNYNTSKENRAYLKRYRGGFDDISFSRKIRILALCYLPFASFAYNHIK